jgi:hypothetical protein
MTFIPKINLHVSPNTTVDNKKEKKLLNLVAGEIGTGQLVSLTAMPTMPITKSKGGIT